MGTLGVGLTTLLAGGMAAGCTANPGGQDAVRESGASPLAIASATSLPSPPVG